MNVLLTGAYSSCNKGDLAMQLTAVHHFREHGANVTASIPFPELDRETYESAGAAVVRSNRRQLIRATWQLVRLGVWRFTGRRFQRLIGDKNLYSFRSADLIVDLSGDMLTEDYGPHVAYSHFVPLLTALLLGRPLVVMAQSIGPFRLTRPLAKAVLRNATLITVRDPVSRQYLSDLGLDPPEVTADLAFALAAGPDDRALAQWEALELGEGRPVLGVSVSDLVATHHRRAGGGDFFAEMASALDAFANRHRAAIVFFPHVTGPSRGKDDRLAAAKVRALMTKDSRAFVADLAPAEIKALISRCDWFLGCRMHANIAALSSRVPAGAIAYSHKTHGIMEQLGLAEFVLDASDVTSEGVGKLLDSIVVRATDISDRLSMTLPEVEAAAADNIERAVAALAGKAR